MAVDDQYTVALMHFDGNLTDEAGNVWTSYGGAATSAAAAEFGSEGLLINSLSDCIRTTAISGGRLDLSAGPWTIEAWAGVSSTFASGDNNNLFRQGGSDYSSRWVFDFTSGNLRYASPSNSIFWQVNQTVSTGVLHHMALCSDGTTAYMCLGGVIIGTRSAFNLPFYNSFNIGCSGGSSLSGQLIDEVRISKVCRYSGVQGSSYNVPTSAFSPTACLPQPIIFF